MPDYSPGYNPFEHRWKNLKKCSTHLRWFPTFVDFVTSVEEGLPFYPAHVEAVKVAIGQTLAHLGEETRQAA